MNSRLNQKHSWFSSCIFYFLFLCFLVFTYILISSLSRPLDDAFISFRYAANLVRNQGLVFNPGERVEGYTNFLWVILNSIAIYIGFSPVSFSVKLGTISYLTSIGIILVSLKNFSPPKFSNFSVALAGLLLILPKELIAFSGTGLETSFVGLLLLSGILCETVYRANSIISSLVPFFFLLLSLTRFVFGIIYPIWFVTTIIIGLTEGRSFSNSIAKFLKRAGCTIILYACYFCWRIYYYGTIFPNTFFAKDHDSFHVAAGIEYATSFIETYPFIILLLPALIFSHFFAQTKELKSFCIFSQIFIISYTAYIILIGGDFMFFRFFLHIYPIFVLLACIGLTALPSMNKVFLILFAGLSGWLSLAPPVLAQKYHMETLQGMYDCCTITGIKYGGKLKALLPPETIISTTMAGAMPYYSGLKAIDQLGLTDSNIGHTTPKKILFRRGHVKQAPTEYLHAKSVNLVFGHPVVCPCDNLCTENLPNVFIRLENNECLRSYYLTAKDSLTSFFCENKDKFILHNVSCAEPEL